MRTAPRLLVGLGVAAIVAGTAATADARCLGSRRPIAGQLALSPPQPANAAQAKSGVALKAFQIELAAPSCADAAGLDGAPVRLEDVRTVQIVVASAAGQRRLEYLTGQQIVVAGYLDAPDPQRQTGDAVLANAWLIAVPSTDGAAAAVADSGLPDPADGASPVVPAPTQPPADPRRADLEAKFARFVSEFYLNGKDVGPELLHAIYAPTLDYYGKPGTSIDYLINSKQGFYSRWPSRVFTLQPGSLLIRTLPGTPDLYELTFAYDFHWSAPGRTRAGVGYVRLQLDMAQGHGKIISEGGKLVDRN